MSSKFAPKCKDDRVAAIADSHQPFPGSFAIDVHQSRQYSSFQCGKAVDLILTLSSRDAHIVHVQISLTALQFR